MRTDVDIEFADGVYRFFLPLKPLIALEERFGSMAGFEGKLRQAIGLNEKGQPIFAGGGEFEAAACREIIRSGLVGGGRALVDDGVIEVTPRLANGLLDQFVYPDRPMGEAAAVAWRVLAAAYYGHEEPRRVPELAKEMADG